MNVGQELAAYLGQPLEQVEKDLLSFSPALLAEAWKAANPVTPEEVENFYKSEAANLYLYDLANWNETQKYREQVAPLLRYRGKKVLDFGGGIGTLSIAMAMNDNRVVYYDINPTLKRFAAQRFRDRMLLDRSIWMAETLDGQRGFDIIAAIDVFEHIHPDALGPLIGQLADLLAPSGILYHESDFTRGDAYPQHFAQHKSDFYSLALEHGLIQQENGTFVKGAVGKGLRIGMPLRGTELHQAIMPLPVVYSTLVCLQYPEGTKFCTVTNKPADEARNEIIRTLQEEWLLFVDADVVVPAETFRRLSSWGEKVVSGVSYMRSGKPDPQVYRYDKQEAGAHWYKPMVQDIANYLARHKDDITKPMAARVIPATRDELLECDGVGADCLLVHKSVLDAIKPPWFKFDTGKQSGEDFFFCRAIQDAGFKIWCDPGVQCGHYNLTLRSYRHFLSYATSSAYPWQDAG